MLLCPKGRSSHKVKLNMHSGYLFWLRLIWGNPIRANLTNGYQILGIMGRAQMHHCRDFEMVYRLMEAYQPVAGQAQTPVHSRRADRPSRVLDRIPNWVHFFQIRVIQPDLGDWLLEQILTRVRHQGFSHTRTTLPAIGRNPATPFSQLMPTD